MLGTITNPRECRLTRRSKSPGINTRKRETPFSKIDLTGAQGWDPALIEEA